MNKLIYMSIVCVLVSGCTSMGITEQKTVRINESDTNKSNGLEVASFPSQLRAAYLYTSSDGTKTVCAEPFADVAASSSLNATASAMNKLSSSLDKSLERKASRLNTVGKKYTLSTSSSGDNQGEESGSSGDNSYSDSADNNINSSFGSTTGTDQSINLGLNAVNEIVALEGRTQFVLLAREMLFRTCEAAANGELENENSVVAKQHKEIFTALIKMIDTQKAKEDAKKAVAETKMTMAILKAAEKLDPKILKAIAASGLNDIILNQYLEKMLQCIGNAANDKSKIAECKKEYNSNLKKLSGS